LDQDNKKTIDLNTHKHPSENMSGKIVALRESIAYFENWISSGCKGPIPANSRKELFKLFSENKDSYTFYRNYLFKICTDLDNATLELEEFIRYIDFRSSSPLHRQVLVEYQKDSTAVRFEDQRLNLSSLFHSIEERSISNATCFIYQSYYEIDAVLTFLATIRKLNEDSVLDLALSNLRDRSGNLKKGLAINFVKAGLKGYTPINNMFENAYNVKLRNSIGHNNYRLVENRLESFDGTVSIRSDEFFRSLWSLQALNNFLVYYFSCHALKQQDFSDCGFLSIGFGFHAGQPVVVLHQLECFYHLNKDCHQWIKRILFNLTNEQLSTTINGIVNMKGEVTEDLMKWFDALRKVEQLTLLVRPISPIIKSDETIKLDCGEFRELDVETCIDVSYDLEVA
jgi:hypothetical protein